MTISAAYAIDQYAGNDVTTNFAVTFPFFGEDEIEVIITVDATGVEIEGIDVVEGRIVGLKTAC